MITMFYDEIRSISNDDIFCGFIHGKLRFNEGSILNSRMHSQPHRIHGIYGIAPSICSGEVLGRYNIAYYDEC